MDNLFKLRENRTDLRTETVAGFTTFMTMAYILAVNPLILSGAGMSKEAVFFATALGAGLVTIAMGLLVNFPIALAPGMGLNAYFASVVAQSGGAFSWEMALGAVFISGLIFILLTISNIRQMLVEAVPSSLKKAITVGIGLFITIIGFKNAHLLVAKTTLIPPTVEALPKTGGFAELKSFEWFLAMGNILSGDALVALIGLVITAILMARRVQGALLIGIVLTTLIGIPLNVTDLKPILNGHGFLDIGKVISFPDLSNLAVGKLDIMGALNAGLLTVIFTFTFVELFDTFGTLVGTTGKAGLLDEQGNNPKLGKAMLVDAGGVSLGALLGTSTITAYIESAAGIGEGGRTGLTAVVTGLLFIAALFLVNLFAIIPAAATAPALILVGLLMMQSVRDIDFMDMTVAIPAFLTIVLMPFTYNIANGITVGIVFYVILKTVTGKAKEVHWLMWVLAALIAIRYIFMGGH